MDFETYKQISKLASYITDLYTKLGPHVAELDKLVKIPTLMTYDKPKLHVTDVIEYIKSERQQTRETLKQCVDKEFLGRISPGEIYYFIESVTVDGWNTEVLTILQSGLWERRFIELSNGDVIQDIGGNNVYGGQGWKHQLGPFIESLSY